MLIFNKDKWLEDVCMSCITTLADENITEEQKADIEADMHSYIEMYKDKYSWVNLINGEKATAYDIAPATHMIKPIEYDEKYYIILEEWCIEKE